MRTSVCQLHLFIRLHPVCLSEPLKVRVSFGIARAFDLWLMERRDEMRH